MGSTKARGKASAVARLASREADAVTGQNMSPNCGQAIVGI